MEKSPIKELTHYTQEELKKIKNRNESKREEKKDQRDKRMMY